MRKPTVKLERLLLPTLTLIMAGLLASDLSTQLWADVVLSSGVVAGLMTLAITATVIDQVLARRRRRRWEPIRSLAMAELALLAKDTRIAIENGKFNEVFRDARQLGEMGEWAPANEPFTTFKLIESRSESLGREIDILRRRINDTTTAWLALLVELDDPEPTIRLVHLAELLSDLLRILDSLWMDANEHGLSRGTSEETNHYLQVVASRGELALRDLHSAVSNLEDVLQSA
jgi:hypothetical protein